MKRKDKIFWITYIYLLVLILIRFIPIIFPGSRSWGFNHLIFLPDEYTYGFFTVALIALIIPFLKFSENMGERLAGWFSEKFLDGRQKYLYRILFIAVMTSLFVIFTAPTHFLGDGYRVIENLTLDSITIYKWTEMGAILLLRGFQDTFSSSYNESARLTFQIFSIISGAITIYFLFLISSIASENNIKRLLLFLSSFLSGILLLFFGYAEYYPIVWVCLTAIIYYSLKFQRSGKGLYFAWFFLLIGAFLHILMAVYIPALLYLTFTAGKGHNFYTRFKKLIISATVLIAVSGISFLIYKYNSDLSVEDIFLPLFEGKPAYPEYAAVSVPHLLDIINEFLLISPTLFLLLFIGSNNIIDILKKRTAIFLGLAALGPLMLLFVIDPKLGLSRDWDLFSMSAFTLSILLILYIKNNYTNVLGRLLPTLILLFSLFTAPFLITNVNRESSERYIEYIIDLDFEKSLSSFSILQGYYQLGGNKIKYDSISQIYKSRYYRDRRIVTALKALAANDIKTATTLMPTIKGDKFDADYQRLLSMYNLYGKRFDKALFHIDNAIQLRKYAWPYYQTRALIYSSQKKYDKAATDLQIANVLNPDFIDIVSGLGYLYDRLSLLDSCILYANKTMNLDSTFRQSYFWLSKSYALKNVKDSALKYKEIYAEFAANDSTLKPFLELLENVISKRINRQ